MYLITSIVRGIIILGNNLSWCNSRSRCWKNRDLIPFLWEFVAVIFVFVFLIWSTYIVFKLRRDPLLSSVLSTPSLLKWANGVSLNLQPVYLITSGFHTNCVRYLCVSTCYFCSINFITHFRKTTIFCSFIFL